MEIKRTVSTRIDAGTLRILKDTYPEGSRVEAIRVRDVKIGMRGIVVEVKDNGDIAVVWNDGESSLVEFGNDSIKTLIEGNCLLKRSMVTGGCEGTKCKDCGWNDAVAKRRIQKICNGGMKKDARGLERLVVQSFKDVVAKEDLTNSK